MIKIFKFHHSFQNILNLIISACSNQFNDSNTKILHRLMNESVKCSAFNTDSTEIISISNDKIENEIKAKNDLNESDAINENNE